MDNSVSKLGKSESSRSPTRLQRQAPFSLHLDTVPDNDPFLQQSSEVVGAAAIPLLSPLFVSPDLHSSLSGEGHSSLSGTTCPSLTEKDQYQLEHKEGWQFSAKAESSNQVTLESMFQTKFMLVDHSE